MSEREIVLNCVEVFNIPLEIPEESLSYSEKYLLQVCRKFAIWREVEVDLSVFDTRARKDVKESLVELAIQYKGKVSFKNE